MPLIPAGERFLLIPTVHAYRREEIGKCSLGEAPKQQMSLFYINHLICDYSAVGLCPWRRESICGSLKKSPPFINFMWQCYT